MPTARAQARTTTRPKAKAPEAQQPAEPAPVSHQAPDDGNFKERKRYARVQLEMLIGKIHRATVTEANVDYVGSITVDQALLDAAGILEYQRVQVVDVDNGNRLETYTIAAEPGSGTVCLNGAAAHCVEVGHKVIVMAYGLVDAHEAAELAPRIVFVDAANRPTTVSRYEKHGQIAGTQ